MTAMWGERGMSDWPEGSCRVMRSWYWDRKMAPGLLERVLP